METEFIKAIGKTAGDRKAWNGVRLYGPLIALLSSESHKYGDATRAEILPNSGTPICGTGVDANGESGEMANCGARRTGCRVRRTGLDLCATYGGISLYPPTASRINSKVFSFFINQKSLTQKS